MIDERIAPVKTDTRILQVLNSDETPNPALHRILEVNPQTLLLTDPDAEAALQDAAPGTTVLVKFTPNSDTASIRREVIREVKVPVEDIELVEDEDIYGDAAFRYEIKGKTLEALTNEATTRGEVFGHADIEIGKLGGDVETVDGKEERLQIIVPVDDRGYPLFGEAEAQPEIFVTRRDSRAALKEAIEAARRDGHVVKLGVVGISLREGGKALITGETTPWEPGKNVKRVDAQVTTYIMGEVENTTAYGTLYVR